MVVELVETWSPHVMQQKINYIHQNPVKEGIVGYPEDYLYSSARDYTREKGFMNDVIVIR